MKRNLIVLLFALQNSFLLFAQDKLIPIKVNYKYGYAYMDKYKINGVLVISAKYDDAYEFSEGLAGIKVLNKWGFIDKTGAIKIPTKYDYVFNFDEGFAPVAIIDKSGKEKWGAIDKAAILVIPCKYDAVAGFKFGASAIILNGKIGFINKKGVEITPAKYDNPVGLPYFVEGMAKVSINGKFGYIDATGKEVVSLKYDQVGNFKEGLAPVSINKKWGFVDKTGKEIIALQYDNVKDFNNEKAWTIQNNEEWLIDKSGNKVGQQLNKTVKRKEVVLDSATYSGKSNGYNFLFVSASSFCVQKVLVNGKEINDNISGDPFKIDLEKLQIKKGKEIILKIIHRKDCSIKLMPGGAINP